MPDAEITAAACGPAGDDVRSDCRVAYTPGAAALETRIASRVDYLYGDAIAATVARVAAALGVDTGRLEVDDGGAVDWVLAARVEACLRRAGFSGRPALPSPAPGHDAPRRRGRMRRSRLYIPGNRPKLMLSAALYGADGLILDLEDSVPPPAKDAARLVVRNALVAMDWGPSERMVRINQGRIGQADLEAVVPHNPHVLLLPKVEDPEQVRWAGDAVRRIAADPPFLMPILESPRGIAAAFEIAAADELVVALTLGLEDLCAELGAPRTADGVETLLARQTTVYAARAAGVQPIASVFSDIADAAALTAYVRRERGLGFDGVGCIHPRQVPVVHRAMTPTAAEVERAQAVVRAAREAEARGVGAVAVGSKMVDPPVVRQAESVIQLAVASGVLDGAWDRDGDEAAAAADGS